MIDTLRLVRITKYFLAIFGKKGIEVSNPLLRDAQIQDDVMLRYHSFEL